MARESFHVEPHGATATARHYIRDVVYGANDGIITTLAVVSGVAGGGLSTIAVIVIGAANLVADGVSMGVGNLLAIRADAHQVGSLFVCAAFLTVIARVDRQAARPTKALDRMPATVAMPAKTSQNAEDIRSRVLVLECCITASKSTWSLSAIHVLSDYARRPESSRRTSGELVVRDALTPPVGYAQSGPTTCPGKISHRA
jgi:hypothetical protein